jgi:hypothetical protein
MFRAKLIITLPKRKMYVYIRDICLSGVVLIAVIFRRHNIQALLDRLFGEIIATIILFVFLLLLGFLSVFYLLSRFKRKVGDIFISNEAIVISENGRSESFPLKLIQNMTIKTDYFIPNEEQVGLYSSYNNWIIFEYLNQKYEFQFVIDSIYKGDQFKELVEYFKADIENFSLTSEKQNYR